MRKKNYYLLHPMVGVAAVVIIIILIASLVVPHRHIFPDSEVVCEAVVVSPVAEQGKTICSDLLITTSPYQGRTVTARILSSADTHYSILDGFAISARIDEDSPYLRAGTDGTTFLTPSKIRRKNVSLSHLSLVQRTRIRMLKLREDLLANLRSNTNQTAYPIIAAMVLGDKSSLSRQTKNLFSQTGASHVLALSGLHIGIVYAFIMLMFGSRNTNEPRRRILTALLSLLPIWAFVMLVGMPVSAIRSATMITIYALILALGRRSPSLNTLALAAVIILVVSPKSLFDIGFQLSFLAMVGIFTVSPLVMSHISMEWQIRNRLLTKLIRFSLITLSAQIATEPLVAYYFHTFSVYFLVNNYLVVPLATAILYTSIVYFLAMPLSAALQSLLGVALSWLVRLLESFLESMSAMPFAVVSNLHPDCLQTCLVYVLIAEILLFLHANKPRRLIVILLTLLFFIVYSNLVAAC